MNAADLKIDLINKITQLNDMHVIKEIEQLLDFELEEGPFKLSVKQKERILEGQEEYRKGKVLSEAKANGMVREIVWTEKANLERKNI